VNGRCRLQTLLALLLKGALSHSRLMPPFLHLGGLRNQSLSPFQGFGVCVLAAWQNQESDQLRIMSKTINKTGKLAAGEAVNRYREKKTQLFSRNRNLPCRYLMPLSLVMDIPFAAIPRQERPLHPAHRLERHRSCQTSASSGNLPGEGWQAKRARPSRC
jgi:hypothetical protein